MHSIATGFNEAKERRENIILVDLPFSPTEKALYTVAAIAICLALVGTIVLLVSGMGIVLDIQDVRAH